MHVYFTGFWSGFHDHTNPVNDTFFVKLLEKVYDTTIAIGTLENSDILVENTQIVDSLRSYKPWRHTYLFSGESYIRSDKDAYDCVLYGQRTHNNVVNVPLYIPYVISSYDECYIADNVYKVRESVPEYDVLVITSNQNGKCRNEFYEQLEAHMNVTYAGHYKNNIGGPLPYLYNSDEFETYVSKFKFIITMENSEEDTYITEKMLHGLFASTIPVYWGSKRVHDYFTKDRFINVLDNARDAIECMKTMTDEEWLRRVNQSPFTKFGSSYRLDAIAKQIRKVLFPQRFPLLNQIIFICNESFEPKRFANLKSMCVQLGISNDMVEFICPTYKHTITQEDRMTYIKTDLTERIRSPTKNAELSLTLNWRACLEYVEAMYKDGMFLTFESDVAQLENVNEFDACLEHLYANNQWSAVQISGKKTSAFYNDAITCSNYCNGPSPYRMYPNRDELDKIQIEDISSPHDSARFIRKFHTRCTDSILWTYNGCVNFLNHMRTDTNYGIPFDYYLANVCETDYSFKYYWSLDTFFYQKSLNGIEESTIQNDS